MTTTEWQATIERVTKEYETFPVNYSPTVKVDGDHVFREILEPSHPDLTYLQETSNFQVFSLNSLRIQSLRAKRELILSYFLPHQDEVIVSISQGKRPIKEEHTMWIPKNWGTENQTVITEVKLIDSVKQRETFMYARVDITNEQLLDVKFPIRFKSSETLSPIATSLLCGFVSHNVKSDQISKALESKGFFGTEDYPIRSFTIRENFLGGWEITDKTGLVWPCGTFVLWIHQCTIDMPEKRVFRLRPPSREANADG